MSDSTKSLPAIEELVRTIRGWRVILDSDLSNSGLNLQVVVFLESRRDEGQ